jgi:hypothetical protein
MKLILIPLTFLISSCSNQKTNTGKEFEGLITFSEKLLAKRTDLIDEENLNKVRGNIHKFYYKNGSYKLESNGLPPKITIYRRGDSLTYTYAKGIDTLFINNIQKESRSLDTLYFTGESTKVLGRKSNELIKKIGKTTYTFYADSSLNINPENYLDYKFGFIDQFYKMTKSLYLKSTYESWVFKIEKIAINIDKKPLSDSLFIIPDYPRIRVNLTNR